MQISKTRDSWALVNESGEIMMSGAISTSKIVEEDIGSYHTIVASGRSKSHHDCRLIQILIRENNNLALHLYIPIIDSLSTSKYEMVSLALPISCALPGYAAIPADLTDLAFKQNLTHSMSFDS